MGLLDSCLAIVLFSGDLSVHKTLVVLGCWAHPHALWKTSLCSFLFVWVVVLLSSGPLMSCGQTIAV